jgi:phosphatidylglycerophosphate synthase
MSSHPEPDRPTPPAAGSGDRRPIASRDTKLAHRLCRALVARGISPNTISVLGMLAGIAAGAALCAAISLPTLARALCIAAAIAIQLRLLANMLDGMVAIESGRTSAVGELYNDVPDRVADTAVLVGLGATAGAIWLGLIAALMAMATAYVRTLGKSLTGSSDFRGPMAKPQRMFLCTLTALWLGLAPAGWQPHFAGHGLPGLVLAVIAVGSLCTALRRLHHLAATLRGHAR